MTKSEIISNRKRFPFNGDFYFEMIFGTVMYSGVFGSFMLLLLKSNLTTETIPSAIPYILITPLFVWWYLKQNRLKRFRNQFTKSTNFNKVRTCLRDLDWAFSTHQNIIYLNSNTFLLKWVFVRIVPLDNEILYSFQYIDGRGFRPLFFVGIRSYLKRKFEKKLNTTTHIAYGG